MNDDCADEIDNRLAPHLEYFADRLNLLFAYHFCVIEFRDDDDFTREVSQNDRAWSLKIIQNACMNSSLIALRDLDDFFSPRNDKTRRDDLRASDFGMNEVCRFLGNNDRDLINKLIAHTTQHGAVNRGYRWDILELVSKAMAQCDSFFEWIKNHYTLDHFNLWTAAVVIQAKSKAILNAVQDEARRQKQD